MDQVYNLVTFDPIDSDDLVPLVVDGDEDELDKTRMRWLSGRDSLPCGFPTAAQLAVVVEH